MPPVPLDLSALAADITAHKVFTSWEVPIDEKDLFACIFMPLFFLKLRDLNKLRARTGLIYEYLTHAVSGRGINGYPIFFSYQTLTKSEASDLRVLLRLQGPVV